MFSTKRFIIVLATQPLYSFQQKTQLKNTIIDSKNAYNCHHLRQIATDGKWTEHFAKKWLLLQPRGGNLTQKQRKKPQRTDNQTEQKETVAELK